MGLSVTPSLWPRRNAALSRSQVLAQLSTGLYVEGLNFPDHLELIQMFSDLTRQKVMNFFCFLMLLLSSNFYLMKNEKSRNV